MLSLVPQTVTLPPVPVVTVGDVVHVPEPVHYPSGRVLRPGHYPAERVEGRRVAVRAALDCSRLSPTFQVRRDPDGRVEHVPVCAEPALVWLDAGDWTAYADGRGPVAIPDRPQIGDGSFSS